MIYLHSSNNSYMMHCADCSGLPQMFAFRDWLLREAKQ